MKWLKFLLVTTTMISTLSMAGSRYDAQRVINDSLYQASSVNEILLDSHGYSRATQRVRALMFSLRRLRTAINRGAPSAIVQRRYQQVVFNFVRLKRAAYSSYEFEGDYFLRRKINRLGIRLSRLAGLVRYAQAKSKVSAKKPKQKLAKVTKSTGKKSVANAEGKSEPETKQPSGETPSEAITIAKNEQPTKPAAPVVIKSLPGNVHNADRKPVIAQQGGRREIVY